MHNFSFVTGKVLQDLSSVDVIFNKTTPEQIVSNIENDLAAGKVEPKDVERMVNEISEVLTSSQPLSPEISNR